MRLSLAHTTTPTRNKHNRGAASSRRYRGPITAASTTACRAPRVWASVAFSGQHRHVSQPRAPPSSPSPPCKRGTGKETPFVPPGCNYGQAHRHGFSDLGRGFCACVPRSRVLLMLVGTHELHPGQVQPGPGSGVERSKEKEKITAGIGA